MKTRKDLTLSLENYSSSYSEEQDFVSRFLDLLGNARAYHRDFLPGHLTGSAFIVDKTRTHALLVHHAKLNRWLQPGGHADGDENIVAVARKEAEEETGLKNLTLLHPLFDIDIHSIPERKEFPQHDHYDIRCLFEADSLDAITISAESHEVQWFTLAAVGEKSGANTSILRMISKLKAFR